MKCGSTDIKGMPKDNRFSVLIYFDNRIFTVLVLLIPKYILVHLLQYHVCLYC